MKVLVSGSHGFIGGALCDYLESNGHEVSRLVRPTSENKEGDYTWDIERGYVDPKAFDGCDAVVHLAAENVAGRWTEEKKYKIRYSRVEGAKVVCDAIMKLDKKPDVYVSASGIGYYGDCGDKVLVEGDPCGDMFLSEVARDREAESDVLRRTGVRVVSTRFGIVLGDGGPLKKMIGPFKFGLGARLGTGDQYWSWVSREDVVRAILHAINTPSLNEPINVVSPNPVTNRQFTKTLAKVLSRPQFLAMPASAVRAMFGELADNVLLASTRAEPKALVDSGFEFALPELEKAFRQILKTGD